MISICKRMRSFSREEQDILFSIGYKFINPLLYSLIFYLMCLSYEHRIYPAYWAMGFSLSKNTDKLTYAYMIILMFSILLPSRHKSIADIFLHVLMLFPLLPMSVLYGMSNEDSYFFLNTFVAFLVIFFISRLSIGRSIKGVLSERQMALVTILLLIFIVLGILIAGGGKNINFDLIKIYDLREEYAGLLPPGFQYFHFIASKVLVPFIVVYGLFYKKLFPILMGIFGGILLFGITQHRTPLFVPFAIIAVYVIFSSKRPIQNFLSFYLILVFISLYDKFSGVGYLFELYIVRRVMFIPAMLNYEYYRFANLNSYVLWSDSKLTLGLLAYPYELSVPYLISDAIGLYGAHSNTGWIGSGYVQFGYLGVWIYAIIIGIVISIVNYFAKYKISPCVVASVFFMPLFWMFISSDLPSIMLTHGMLVIFIIFLLIKTRKNELY